MASQNIIELTSVTFDAAVQASATIPLVVDFWAPWCGPCKALTPVLGQIADELGGAVSIAKVNVDDEADLAQKFSVQNIPTLAFFKGGQFVGKIVGGRSKSELLAEIQKVL
jgi:thioredoxin 1